MKLKLKIISFLTFAFIAPGAPAAQKTGSVCVQKISNSTQKNVGAPNAQETAGNKVQINGKTVRISSEAGKIVGLSLRKKHLVKIYFDQTLKQSFKFSFKDYDSARLCLFQNDFYGTWQLWEAARVKDCGCR